ncbi:MAG: VOC family protein [Chitinophagaceae bacterium]
MNIPQTHQVLMPYLIVNGARRFAGFVKDVFGATQTFEHLREDNETVMHAEVQISGATIMFADATDQYRVANANMFIYVPDANTAFAKALEAGATVVNELADRDYGRSGGVQDPFGNVWWITSVKG